MRPERLTKQLRAFAKRSMSYPGPVTEGLPFLRPPGLPPNIKTKERDKRNGTPERRKGNEQGKKRGKEKKKRNTSSGGPGPPLVLFVGFSRPN